MSRLSLRFVNSISFVLALSCLLYELLIAQTISFLAVNNIFWYSITIGLYLFSMGLGSLLAPKIIRSRDEMLVLVGVELILSLIGGLNVGVICFNHIIFSFIWEQGLFGLGLFLFFGVYAFIVLMLGFLVGLEIPILIKAARANSSKSSVAAQVLAFDYFGSLLAGLIFPLVLLPHFSLIKISFFLSLVNAGVALIILSRIQQRISVLKWSGFILIFVFSFGVLKESAIRQFFSKSYYYAFEAKNLADLLTKYKNWPAVEERQSVYQRMDIVKALGRDKSIRDLLKAYGINTSVSAESFTLFIDGDFQFNSDAEKIYHEYFAHAPVALAKVMPEKILILGAGDGLLLREMIKYPSIKEITLVEIDPSMIDLARHHPLFRELNQSSLADPRVKVVNADAFHYLRRTRELFDAIYIDFPDPKDYNVSKLYSREFYAMAYKHLKPDGFAVLDAPQVNNFINQDSQGMTDIFYQTFRKAGFENILLYGSQLETDNPAVLDLVSSWVGDVKSISVQERDVTGERTRTVKGKEAIVQSWLKDFVNDFDQKFFILKKNSSEPFQQYHPLPELLDILNQRRLTLLLQSSSSPDFSSLTEDYNSLMKVRIPDNSLWWRVKMAH